MPNLIHSFAENAPTQHSVVFISADVKDYDTLLANLSNDVEAYLLNAEQDGVFQMAAILRERSGLDSIHILSHGSSGSLFLGSSILNSDNLVSYVNALTQIGSSLSETGDILLYGCNVAQGETGFHFIDNLARYTRVNVAASTNLTGSAALGGDWLLQAINTGGSVKTPALQIPNYEGVLGVGSYTVNFYAADPALNNGPFAPTYAQLTPADIATFPIGSANNPLANAQAYAASPATATNLDAVTSLASSDLKLGQIVPFFIEIIVGDNTGDPGTIVIKPEWLTQTTTGSNFGFDPTVGNNGILAAFVDTGDPQHTDTGAAATVINIRTTVLDKGLPTERISSAINVDGLNTGDKVIVEVWVALKPTIPVGATGDVQASIAGATVLEQPITAVDQAPVSVVNVVNFSNILTDGSESVTTFEDTSLSGNVLSNTVNPNDFPNAASVTTFTVAGDANPYAAGQTATIAGVGTLLINSNGTYTFASASNYAGAVPVATYTVTDGAKTTTSTLTINVTPVNDAPAGTNATVTTLEDAPPYTLKVADFGFTDANDNPANNLANVIITVLPTTGALQLNGVAVTANQAISVADITGGLLKFVPITNGNGANYANFSFKVQDDGGTANNGVDTSAAANTLTINVTPVNDAPAGTNGTVTALEDVAYAFKAADFGFTDVNDSPANNFANLIITSLPVSGSLQLGGVAIALNQVIPVASIANLTFTSAPNANGSNYASFDFKVQDDGGTANSGVDTSTANTLTINVTPVNDAPAGTNGTVTALEDVAYAFKAADFGFTDANDSPANNLANLIITSLPVSGDLKLGGFAVTLNQVIPVASIANLTFTGAPNANGSNYASFGFKVQDDGGTANGGVDTSTANTLTINVTPINDVPVAVNDTGIGAENTTITGSLATNDIPSGDGGNVWALTTAATNGTAVVNADGSYSYTPTANFNGIDSFSYKITDANGDISTATVSLTITPVNNLPVAVNDTGTGAEDTVITGNLATNDTPSGDGGNVWALATAATNGTAVVNADGTYSYTPTANFNGTDSFSYKITDVNGDISTATVSLTITPVNDLPVAVNDTGTGAENTVITGDLAANDIPSGDGGNVWTLTTIASNGIATVNPDGTYSYTPNANFNGTDSFTYTITDANTDTSTATVNLTINPQSQQALHIEKIATVADGSADKVGELINYTMAVTNAGNTAINNVQVNDPFTSNETPVLNGLFNAGDTNKDGLLNVGETWQYTASHTLTQAEIDAGTNIVNTATVTGDNATPASATVSTAVVQTPSLSIDKVTVYGTQTGDGLTGVIAGHNIGWDYTVTNTGNVSLSNISIQDDNGTLTNNSDNFFANPVLSGSFNVGDTNADGKLNPNEVWHFSATGIAVATSYSNIATVSATIGTTIVTATDASSYVGIVDPNVPSDCDDHGDHGNHGKPDNHGEQSTCGDSSDHGNHGKPDNHGEQSTCGDSSDHGNHGKPDNHGEQSTCGDSSDHGNHGKPDNHGEQSTCGDSSDHGDHGKPDNHGEQSTCGDSSDHGNHGKPDNHGEQSTCGDSSDHGDHGKPDNHGEQSTCGDSSDHGDHGKPDDHGEQSTCGDSSDHGDHGKPDDHGEQSTCGDSSDHGDHGKPDDHGEQSTCGDSSDHGDHGKPDDHGEQSTCGDSSDHGDHGKPDDHGEQSTCGDSSDHGDHGKPDDHGEQSACGDSSDHGDHGKPDNHGEQSACGDSSDHGDHGKPDNHGEQSACGDSSDHGDHGKPDNHGDSGKSDNHGEQAGNSGDYAQSVSKNAESHDQAINVCTQNGSDTIDFSAIRDSKADNVASYGGWSAGHGEVNLNLGSLLSTDTNNYGHDVANDTLSFDNWSGNAANHHIELVGVQNHQPIGFS